VIGKVHADRIAESVPEDADGCVADLRPYAIAGHDRDVIDIRTDRVFPICILHNPGLLFFLECRYYAKLIKIYFVIYNKEHF